MGTSGIISRVATLVALLIGTSAAYGLSRYDFKGKALIKYGELIIYIYKQIYI